MPANEPAKVPANVNALYPPDAPSAKRRHALEEATRRAVEASRRLTGS